MVFGHGGNTVTRMPGSDEGPGEAGAAGGGRPAPDHLRQVSDRKDGTYLLPICTQFEMRRQPHRLQPLAAVGRQDRRADLREPKTDYDVHATRWPAPKLGFAAEMFSTIEVKDGDEPTAESILREINRGALEHRLYRASRRSG